MNPGAAKNSPFRAFERFELADFTIGAEGSDTINVAVQLKDALNKVPTGPLHAKVYLSDAATGLGLTATATTSALAIGTNGSLLGILTTGKVCDVVSDAQGRFDLNIIQTAAPVTYYLVICKPDGGVIVSEAITFA